VPIKSEAERKRYMRNYYAKNKKAISKQRSEARELLVAQAAAYNDIIATI
jgi:hypothetical protein